MDVDRVRQQEIAFTLGQRLRAKAEDDMRKVNAELQEERARRHRLIDATLAVELNKLRQRAQSGLLLESDLDP